MWITVAIIGFVILMAVGNFMAAKPKAHEVRLGELRMAARKLGLNPRLLACPDWLSTKQSACREVNKGMIACYTLINDDWQLPRMHYLAKDGHWHGLADDGHTALKFNTQGCVGLDGQAIALPALAAPTVRGLVLQSNSIRLYWYDEDVASQLSADGIDTLLNELKTALQTWADTQMAKTSASGKVHLSGR